MKTKPKKFIPNIITLTNMFLGFLAIGLIINGDNDRVVPSIKVSELVDKLQHQKGITISPAN